MSQVWRLCSLGGISIPSQEISMQSLPYVWPLHKPLLSEESAKTSTLQVKGTKGPSVKCRCLVCARPFHKQSIRRVKLRGIFLSPDESTACSNRCQAGSYPCSPNCKLIAWRSTTIEIYTWDQDWTHVQTSTSCLPVFTDWCLKTQRWRSLPQVNWKLEHIPQMLWRLWVLATFT